ncbi:glycosyltransferase [Candidatus Pelagibacter sp.]|jgi:dolichol-phosphate mannosyltransferase|nr:glycosyltransferase [Candidatus Pelagibacter sp.]|tara:strand:- start:1764 stop:2480 length:717 start_codon:yes stop_codon:yes gene_type:complete
MKEISIIIPILNESENIKLLIPEISKNIKILKIQKYEIILVDDNSEDQIELVVRKLRKKFKSLKLLIRRKKDKDLSKSCILGFEKSKYKNILVMDGDFQHHPKYILNLVKNINKTNCDIVVGARDLTSTKKTKLSIFRLGSSFIATTFLNIALGKKTSDPLTGFFLFKKKIYKKNKKHLFAKGYKILADLIYSSKEKLNIIDVDINFSNRARGESKMSLKILIILISFIAQKIQNRVF